MGFLPLSLWKHEFNSPLTVPVEQLIMIILNNWDSDWAPQPGPTCTGVQAQSKERIPSENSSDLLNLKLSMWNNAAKIEMWFSKLIRSKHIQKLVPLVRIPIVETEKFEFLFEVWNYAGFLSAFPSMIHSKSKVCIVRIKKSAFSVSSLQKVKTLH